MMNYFTKEELNYMADGLALIIGRCAVANNLKQEILDLSGKIQSLIENYCDHDWREGMCQICDKCDAMKEY